MAAHGDWQASIITITSLDGYLREQDWAQLKGEDIVVAREANHVEVALLLGRSHRGESVKTGQDQGIKLEDETVRLT